MHNPQRGFISCYHQSLFTIHNLTTRELYHPIIELAYEVCDDMSINEN